MKPTYEGCTPIPSIERKKERKKGRKKERKKEGKKEKEIQMTL